MPHDVFRIARWLTGPPLAVATPPVDGTPLDDGEPARLILPRPTSDKGASVMVVGGTGSGKTLLIGPAVADEFIESHRSDPPDKVENVIVLDPKNDSGIAILQRIALLAPHLLGFVTILDPFDVGFAFNLTKFHDHVASDVRAFQLAGIVAETTTNMGGLKNLSIGARQLDTLLHVLLCVMTSEHPNRNPLWCVEALSTKHGLTDLAQITRDPAAVQFAATAELNDELRASSASRLRLAFGATSGIRAMTTAGSCCDFNEMGKPGRMTVLLAGSPPAGMAPLSSFFINVVARYLIDSVMAHSSPWQGHHTRLLIDEFQCVAKVLESDAERVLTQGRSRGLSVLALLQSPAMIHEISPTLLQVMAGNISTKLVGRLNAQSADLFVRDAVPRLGTTEPPAALRARLSGIITNLDDRNFIAFRPGERVQFHTRDVELQAAADAVETHSSALEAAMVRWPVGPLARSVSLSEAAEQLRRSRPHPRDRARAAPAATQPDLKLVPAADPGPTESPPARPSKGRWG